MLAVACGGSDPVPIDGTGPKATEPITAAVASDLDVFVKNTANLVAESNGYQQGIRNDPDASPSQLPEIAERFRQFTDQWRRYCVEALDGVQAASGTEEQVWRAGSDWCEVMADMWSRATEVTEIAANGGPAVDDTNPDDIALYKRSEQLGQAFLNAYCSYGGSLCSS
jgi:hypothetical protein